MQETLINIHTHHPTGRPGYLEVENLRFGQEESGLSSLCTAGLHPWFLSETTLEVGLNWLRKQASRPTVIAIGEMGLDKATITPWPLQMETFEQGANMAETFHKPLLIHCVRAYADIIALKKAWKPVQPWIFHGFDKNNQVADMLLNAGCFLSFGKALLNDAQRATTALFHTPPDRFFLETDNADVPLEEIYGKAAAIRAVSLQQLATQVSLNVQHVFGLGTANSAI